MILDYFTEIKSYLNNFKNIISDLNWNEKVYSSNLGFIEGQIVFNNNFILEFAEVKDIENSSKVKYRYHFMDDKKTMIFRYDNAKHFPKLSTFPHHKHLPDRVIESHEPKLKVVLSEIEKFIINLE